MIENPFVAPIKRDGKLTPARWQLINKIIGRTSAMEHDQLLTDFSDTFGIPRRQLKATIKTFRLASPPMLQ